MIVPTSTPAGGNRDWRPELSQARTRLPEVDRRPRGIHQQARGRRGGHKRRRRQLKSCERGGSQAALIAGHAAKETREHTEHTDKRAARLPVPRPAGQLCESSQNEQPAEHAGERRRSETRVEDRARQCAGRAHDSEAREHAADRSACEAASNGPRWRVHEAR